MPKHGLVKRITRWRMIGAFAAVATVAVAATLTGSVAQGRVDPGLAGRAATLLSVDTIAIATGGGTIESDPTTIASFGINAKRPAGFNPPGTNGAAQGRINYDKHAQVAGGRHVNVPVAFMTAEIANPQTGNQTGGKAELVGDCQAPGAECPTALPGTKSVLVHVEDNSDSGAGFDVFRILYCTSTASQTIVSPVCPFTEADITLRTGNIQIRTNVSGSGGNAPTSARAPIRLP
jgi:hypothetical protein